MLSDLGPHMIDQALLLFGMPDAVSADMIAQRAGREVDDYFDLTLHYGERRVCLRCSTLIAEPRPRFAVHGSGGSFVKYGLDPQEAQLKAGMDPRDARIRRRSTRRHARLRRRHARRRCRRERGNYLAFYEARRARRSSTARRRPVDPADARDGLLLIDLARRAAALGQRLPVPAASSPASVSAGSVTVRRLPRRCRATRRRASNW